MLSLPRWLFFLLQLIISATLSPVSRGQDTALETEEEEKKRTGEGNMLLFNRSVEEGRTLVTTSTRLMLRTGAYLVWDGNR